MDIDKLIEAIKLCGSQPDVRQCINCAYYAGGDMSRCIPRMTAEAAEALSTLKAELEQAKREGMSMERLTYWCDDGQGGGEWRVNIDGREERGLHVDRLAAYEETSLSPEEVVKMGMMFEDSKRYSGRLELKLKLASVVLEEMKNG